MTSPEAPRDRFDKFTEPARDVLRFSQGEAERLGHRELGTEHLLLGIARVDMIRPIFQDVLSTDLDILRGEVLALRPRGDASHFETLTDDAKAAIGLAVTAAVERRSRFIGISHMVTGLARGQGIGHNLLMWHCDQRGAPPEEVLIPRIREVEAQSIARQYRRT